MSPISGLERFLSAISLLLSAALIAKMVKGRLYCIYTWFFVYLCIGAAQSLASLPLDPNTNIYSWIYRLSQPVVWLLYILIVLELYSLVLHHHQGISSVGRWTLLVALVVSVMVSLLTLLPDLRSPTGPYPVLTYYTVIERGIISSLVIFLLLIMVFLVWYPIPLNRNVILHAVVFSVYFLSSTMVLFVRNITGYELTRAVSTVLIAVANVCLMVWILFLNRQGEARIVVLRRQWYPHDEEKLVKQLDEINSVLLRTSRK